MDSKGPDAFRTISEVAGDLDLPQHVLRFWETRFSQIKPLKRGGGRRYYRPDDVDLLRGIRHLLYDEGYTIKGVQRILKERGIRFVSDAVGEDGVDAAGSGEAMAANDEPINTNHTPQSAQEASPGQVVTALAPAAHLNPVRDSARQGSDRTGDENAAEMPDKVSSDATPAPQSDRPPARSARVGGEEPVPRDIILDDPPARKADGRSLIDKIRGVQEPEQAESPHPAQLSRDDIRRLQSTLFELLECKRILDRSRSG